MPEDACGKPELVFTDRHFFFFHPLGSFEVKSISVRIGEKFMYATVPDRAEYTEHTDAAPF